MVVHIVFFKFKEERKNLNIQKAKEMLLHLANQIDELLFLEVGENFAEEQRAMDLCLVANFNSKKDLESYAVHPDHLVVVEFIKSVVEYSKVVDYETK